MKIEEKTFSEKSKEIRKAMPSNFSILYYQPLKNGEPNGPERQEDPTKTFINSTKSL
jgi:hypothetical protein